ncbi:alpha/beta hydrolase [Micromonospora sp. WMMD998]|uniref:alpha/beta hydrolase n=1 Tax=Micromonospora sp. WMMD998 TaxID=3016092 RepID=UPI00249BD329|nr:alpha/beta hydrolase [Micromonospora sp. WMMD998]WFE40931.1 alpha/beta hydrolase [Micromonospora sp. WMMD998]
MLLTVVIGPGLVADTALLTSLVAGACAELDVTGEVVAAASTDELRSRLAAPEGPVVVLPGPTPPARALIGAQPPHAVWYDLTVEPPVPGAVHLAGRGAWGVVWAVRHAVHRFRAPATRVAYGSHPEQWGDLRLPVPHDTPAPVAVLLHGGFWRSVWGADLMDALAVDLADRGYASWNVEYRRPDRHGWDATTRDVEAGLAALRDLAADRPLDLGRVVVLGHSAGGQLALRAAADLAGRAGGPRVALAVSLAGVLDLTEGERRHLGDGAISAALGGSPATAPRRYAESDPMLRLPVGVPTLLVQGTADSPDLVDANRRYAVAAAEAGDAVRHLEQPGDHFAVIDSGADIWQDTMAAVDAHLGR